MMIMVYTTNGMIMFAVDCMVLPQLLSKLSKALSLPIRKSLHYTSSYDDDDHDSDSDNKDEDLGGDDDDDKDKLNVVLFVF